MSYFKSTKYIKNRLDKNREEALTTSKKKERLQVVASFLFSRRGWGSNPCWRTRVVMYMNILLMKAHACASGEKIFHRCVSSSFIVNIKHETYFALPRSEVRCRFKVIARHPLTEYSHIKHVKFMPVRVSKYTTIIPLSKLFRF